MKHEQETYRIALQQAEALITDEPDCIANLSNIVALLREATAYFWIGFYIVRADELVLGPFQGPVACTRIGLGRGVCGAAWRDQKTYDVPDVHAFPGHIACNASSLSEVVAPVIVDGQVVAVLDVDSDNLADFTAADRAGIESIALLIAKYWSTWS